MVLLKMNITVQRVVCLILLYVFTNTLISNSHYFVTTIFLGALGANLMTAKANFVFFGFCLAVLLGGFCLAVTLQTAVGTKLPILGSSGIVLRYLCSCSLKSSWLSLIILSS